jgi:hypothetical protein
VALDAAAGGVSLFPAGGSLAYFVVGFGGGDLEPMITAGKGTFAPRSAHGDARHMLSTPLVR